MNRFAAQSAAILTAITLSACSGGTVTSPSPVPGSFAQIGIQRDSNDSEFPGWSASELSFATTLANTEFALIWFGTRAETLGDRPEVKAFSRELRRHYEAAFDELTQVGGTRLPRITTLNSSAQNFNTRLTSVTGSEFDRLFMQYVVETIRSNIALLRSQGPNPDSALGRLAASEAQSEAELLQRGIEIARIVGVTGLD